MARTPFNSLTFLIDTINDDACELSLRGAEAVAVALDRARAEGNRDHFERLAVKYRMFENDVAKLAPNLAMPAVSLDFAAAEAPRQAA